MFITFRYLARQVLVSMCAVTLVLLLVFLGGRFIKYLGQAAAGGLSPDVLFALVGYRMPAFLELILPLGLFIGILLAYGRMYLESEMTVLHACGYSHNRLAVQTILASLLVSAIVASMSLYISPWGIRQVDRIFIEQTKLTEFEMLTPGRFQTLRSGARVTYTESMSDDKRQLRNVFISEKSKDGTRVISVTADTGFQQIDEESGSRFLVLSNGTRFEGIPGSPEYKAIKFKQYGVKIDRTAGERRNKRVISFKTSELLKSDNLEHRAMLQWRLSLPLLVPIVTLLAVSLSRVNPRQGRFIHILPAMLIYVTYLGLLIVARKQVAKGRLPEIVGLWPVHILFLSISMGLFYRDAIGRWWHFRKLDRLPPGANDKSNVENGDA